MMVLRSALELRFPSDTRSTQGRSMKAAADLRDQLQGGNTHFFRLAAL